MADESWIKSISEGVLGLVDRIGTKAFVATVAIGAVFATIWFVNKAGLLERWIVIAAIGAIVAIAIPFFWVQLNEKKLKGGNGEG